MKFLNHMPLLWKVLSAPIIAMACMALYLGSTTLVFQQNNSRLVSVRDVQFPVLDATTENIGALDKIIDNLNGAAASGEKDQLQVADTIAAKIRANYTKLRAIDAEQTEILQRLATEFDAYYAAASEVALSMVNKTGTLDPKALQSMSAKLDVYRKDLTTFREAANQRFTGTIGHAIDDADRTIMTGAVIGLAGLVSTLVFGVLIARSLLTQMGSEPAYAVEVAGKIASGDLAARIETKAGDQSSLLFAIKAMRDSLALIVGEVRSGTDTIATASGQIAGGNLDLSSRTEQQAGSLEETASSMEELTSAVKQNADNARQANQLAASASEVAQKGGAVVSQVVDTMGSINDSAKKIVDIIGVIDGIAFQTNILALNAAVEAARAGEQGRGFAVVASEVRNLAQRSAAAAKEIKTLIGDSVEKVDAGAKLVDQAGTTMNEIVESVRRVTDIMSEITAASQEQSSGIEEIGRAIMQMDEMTQQNAALVEEAAAAAESLQEQSAGLAQVVSVFKLNEQQGAAPVRKGIDVTLRAPETSTVKHISTPRKNPKMVANTKSVDADNWEQF